jgi:methionine synthase II (cobalamin-independent)
MSPKVHAATNGIHSRSEETVRKTRDFDRERTTKKSLDESFLRDASDLVALQESLGFKWISDGQLRWQDLLRPLSESVTGLRLGADLFRWYDTNTFYRRPNVFERLNLENADFVAKEFVERYTDWNNIPKIGNGGTIKKITLPGPYTLASLSENSQYPSIEDLTFSFAKVLSALILGLAKAGISCVQLSEPSLVYRYGQSALTNEDHLKAFLRCVKENFGSLGTEIWLQTSFGDSAKILRDLIRLEEFELVGVDFTQTSLASVEGLDFSQKLLGCGCVDGRNSLIESPQWISEFVKGAQDTLKPKGVVITSSTDLKYLPRKYSDEKLRSIGEAIKLLTDN